MGARKDHITGIERAQIAMEMLPENRPHGKVTELAKCYQVSRQTIYSLADKGKVLLEEGMEPGPHGAQVQPQMVRVDRERIERGMVVLTGCGVSQRDIPLCMEAMLDTHLSASWINSELAQREELAAVVNQEWQPQIAETLSGDEIYSNGQPNLMVVGNDSLFIYALTRQPSCDGDTWACVLLDSPKAEQFSSDAGTGLAAGAQTAGIAVHQLDWDHLLRPLWGQAARLERQAYAALVAVEERTAQFLHASTEKRLAQHLAAWERLCAVAQARLAQADQFAVLARQVDEQFALIDRQTGLLRDPVSGAQALRTVGTQLGQWSGKIYAKLSSNLLNWAEGLFAYQPILQQALLPFTQQWGAPVLHALARLWQVEANAHRQPPSCAERSFQQATWNQCLDQAVSLLGNDALLPTFQDLCLVLNRSWRGSMLCECVNSLLRPLLAARKSSDQGCLELFRFLHNVHRFPRGKRAGFSPAELVGIHLPADPLSLLGFAPKCQSNSLPS